MEKLRELLKDEQNIDPDLIIRRSLKAVREHLGMEVAYLSEIVDGQSVFRAIDSGDTTIPVGENDSIPLDQVYCEHILKGRLPNLMPDVMLEPVAAAMPITAAMPINSHVSVPIYRTDGSVYGMFCCLSSRRNTSLNDRDLKIMQMFAELSSGQINEAITERQKRDEIVSRTQAALTDNGFHMVYQPILNLDAGVTAGFEALARFHSEPYRPPDIWFDEAESVGLGIELEIAAIKAALAALQQLPDEVYIAVNAAAETISSGKLADVLADYPAERIVVELTERAVAKSGEILLREIQNLRFKGVRLAIDDVGTGYSGLAQIVSLSPDIIKLDRSLVTEIDRHERRHSLASALVNFANQSKSVIVAEGIETENELKALKNVGIHLGQGWLLGRPATLEAFDDQIQSAAELKAG
ncbi:sensor domain-containing phosphodiesterase [Notoacmeibacter marinus]|uniref:sensor domain-containing phosphodiesterase n=1 Tax=Notoacmeibacter marinus TaxID=1876515 RepID=UPI0013B0519B|nr:EAL domain-containing protein [Notoacmeibacter marinus]